MYGLLGSEFDDPKTQGILALGLGLLGGRGNFGQALSQAGAQGIGAYQGARQNAAADELRKMQMAQMGLSMKASQQEIDQRERMAQLEEARRKALAGSMTPGAVLPMPVTMDNRDVGLPGEQSLSRPGGLDLQAYAARLAEIGDPSAISIYQSLQKNKPAPITLKEGDRLLDPETMRELANNPKAPDLPSAVREYQFAVNQGYRGSFTDWELSRKKAGASSVSLAVNAEKPLVNTIATGLGTQLDTSLAQAKSALGAIGNAKRLEEAASSGKIVAGPGANFAVVGLQVGQMLGIGGKDQAETLANTRQAIQAMAQAELDAAQQMKGQGQITESERDIIRRAAAGEIQKLTAGEIVQLAQTTQKIARQKIANHQRSVQQLGSVPGAAPLMPFYQVNAPEDAPRTPGRVVDFGALK